MSHPELPTMMQAVAPSSPELPQPIAGVAPSNLAEVTVMVVWPSMAATGLGRFLGRLFSIDIGIGNVLTIGNLIALATIPITMPLYFAMKMSRYRLTNQRVLIETGPHNKVARSVSLDDIDAIDVDVLPGQAWYPAGELIFRRGNIETMRLSGVLRPETFRQTCLKSARSFAGVKRSLG